LPAQNAIKLYPTNLLITFDSWTAVCVVSLQRISLLLAIFSSHSQIFVDQSFETNTKTTMVSISLETQDCGLEYIAHVLYLYTLCNK